MDVSIIIVNWNVRGLLYNCLQSIFLFAKETDYEVTVIDNDSKDGSREMLRMLEREYKNLRVILNNENTGFAKANNQGLRAARGKYVLFMNPDMEFVENTAKKMFNYMETHPDAGAVTCGLQYGSGRRQPNVKRNPTFLSQVWILYKLHHFFQPAFFKNYLAKDFDYSREQAAEQIMGAFIFARRDLIIKIGGWSEDYFVWWEDVDLCTRLRRLGETIMYVPDTSVIHYESQSFSQQLSLTKQRRFNRGLLTYFKKYHSSVAWLFLTLISWDSLVLAWLVQVLKFRPKSQAKL